MLTSVKQLIISLKLLTFDPMLEKKYKNIILLIGLTIVITIAVQFYWNLKIYEVNKLQFNNQVHVSFDKAIENYYNELAKSNVFSIIESDSLFLGNHPLKIKSVTSTDTISRSWELSTGINMDHVFIDKAFDSTTTKKVVEFHSININSDTFSFSNNNEKEIKQISIINGDFDSIKIHQLTNKIMFAFNDNVIDLVKIDSLFTDDLEKKSISILHGLKLGIKNPLTNEIIIEELNTNNFPKQQITISSNSSFVPHNTKLQLIYTDTTLAVLKRMLGSILLSLLLSVFIIGCLLFLLNVIFKQKQLSEIKNDFISNITHEFKTPISTISVALEGIENFDIIKDSAKRKQYLAMSNEQLGKLNVMVEKLLETATLKADQFALIKETINLSELTEAIIKKHQLSDQQKSISSTIEDNIVIEIDPFHFENALNNIIDNSVKYGGNHIQIELKSNDKEIEISFEDNGNGIAKKHLHQIFDQFYRIPTGDIHNIKGFGIGLYYTKQIIEKHEGQIYVSDNKKGKVVFKIKLPYETSKP